MPRTASDPAPGTGSQSEGGSSAFAHHLSVYRGADFVVTRGANLGDGLQEAAALTAGDIYTLAPGATRLFLQAAPGRQRRCLHLDGGEGGATRLWLDALLTFMGESGSSVEALGLVATRPGGQITAHYLLPLAPMAARDPLMLVAIDRKAAPERLAEAACVSFAAGTRITMADGSQRPVEVLRVGQRVLTRNHGPRPIRWIGRQVVRASGSLTPVRIAPGVLNNTGPLLVSPNHRLFVWQRRDRLGTRGPEVAVRAGLLVNGDSVQQVPGGFVEYLQLRFDRHEIVYAEGIATESQPADERLRPLTGRQVAPHPNDASGLAEELAPEVIEALDPASAAELLRRSSAC